MQRHATRRTRTRLGAAMATVVAMSALTPTPAHASETCGSLAAGAYRAVYNTTGSTFLAYKAAEAQYYSCRAIELLTR